MPDGFTNGIKLNIWLSLQTGSGTHPAYYARGTGSSFPGGKAAGV